MGDPAEAIRKRLHQLGLSQARFSVMVGKSPGWAAARFLPNVEGAVRYMQYREPETLTRLLRALQWTPEEFSQETGIPLEPPSPEIIQMAQVPVVGVVSAGRGESYVEPLGHVEVPQEIVARYGDGLFALRVSGDSMFCEELPYAIPPGAYVVVAPHLAPQPGDVVVVWNEEHNVGYLKEYQPKEKGYQVLRSWNPEVPPIVVQPEDSIRIQGVVVYVGFNPREVQRRALRVRP